MDEYKMQFGDRLVVKPPQRLECAEFCPGARVGCPLGAFVAAEVTGVQIAPTEAYLISPIGTVCMANFTPEQPPAVEQ